MNRVNRVSRVSRAPLRKLSLHERFNCPAAELADADAVELAQILTSSTADEAAAKITGLAPDHPLLPAVSAVVEEAKAAV